jgi:hypothetical protein
VWDTLKILEGGGVGGGVNHGSEQDVTAVRSLLVDCGCFEVSSYATCAEIVPAM